MGLLNRLAKLEAAAESPEDREAAREAAIDRQCLEWQEARLAAFLPHVPEGLQVGVAERWWSGDWFVVEWILSPFASWANGFPAGFVFPREFVEFILDPPRKLGVTHNCEVCGMSVPIWSHDGRQPASEFPGGTLTIFPTCPACGGKVTYSGAFRRGTS